MYFNSNTIIITFFYKRRVPKSDSYPFNVERRVCTSFDYHKVWLWSRVRQNERTRRYDVCKRHKDPSLKGYLTIRIWDLAVANRRGTTKFDFWQISQRSTIDWGRLTHESSGWSLRTSKSLKFWTRSGQWFHQKNFPISFCQRLNVKK